MVSHYTAYKSWHCQMVVALDAVQQHRHPLIVSLIRDTFVLKSDTSTRKWLRKQLRQSSNEPSFKRLPRKVKEHTNTVLQRKALDLLEIEDIKDGITLS